MDSNTNNTEIQAKTNRLINVLWISHHEMDSVKTAALSDYIFEKFHTDSFYVKRYSDIYERFDVKDFDVDVDLICVDGMPRFLEDVCRNTEGIPVAVFSKYNNENKWHTYFPPVNAKVKKGPIKNVKFLLVACSIFVATVFCASFYTDRIDAENVLIHNLEHRFGKAVSLLDFEHLEHDIYLARCNVGNKEFNAYLYYDTSTVRIDEGSYLTLPDGYTYD